MMKLFLLSFTSIYAILLGITILFGRGRYGVLDLEISLFSLLLLAIIILLQKLISKSTNFIISAIYTYSFVLYLIIYGFLSVMDFNIYQVALENIQCYKAISDEYYDEGYVSVNGLKYLYPKGLDAEEVLKELNSIDKEISWGQDSQGFYYRSGSDEYATITENILFWQTGAMLGYTPIPLDRYQVPKSFWRRAFEFGPVYSLEYFLSKVHIYLFVAIYVVIISKFRPDYFFDIE
ncbi:MAG TPA: hypothetical protein PKE06_12995 [Flavilitoribacter sp.]|nr:hypothetical protein [Flavilitoribacter sp.]HMQ89572.1 hypothetical protein [Flavilitoribacter sp.]